MGLLEENTNSLYSQVGYIIRTQARKMVLGARVAARRRRIKMTQAELARLVDSNQQYISDLENGKNEMRESLFTKIKDALKTNASYLYGEIEYDEALTADEDQSLARARAERLKRGRALTDEEQVGKALHDNPDLNPDTH